MKSKNKTIGVLDFETDPFKRGRLPVPFCAGLYVTKEHLDGSEDFTYKAYWEDSLEDFDDQLDKLIDDISQIHGYIYAHNGGKFDFHFILQRLLTNGIEVLEIKLIKSRIAKLRFGKVTLLDSWLLLPMSLKATGQKLDFEYWKTEAYIDDLTPKEVMLFDKARLKEYKMKSRSLTLIQYFEKNASPRNFYKKECLVYLKQDCKGLSDIILEFINLYGFGLTLAGRSFAEIKASGYKLPRRLRDSKVSGFGDFEKMDSFFRKWFFGGRVQTFKLGHIKGNIKYHDINSAYPFAMTKNHWSGDLASYWECDNIENLTKAELATSLLKVTCRSFGAFPVRGQDNGISFPNRYGTYHVTGHEFVMAKKLDLLEDIEVKECFVPIQLANFGKFVRTVHKRKNEASKRGDLIQRLIHKFVMNSGFGRLAIDPREWKDHKMIECGSFSEDNAKEGWQICERYEELKIDLLERQTSPKKMVFHNVAIAASITGYVRAMLMEAIASVDEPIYCDTDSIVSRGKVSLKTGTNLGDWALEASGKDGIHIAGKKLYAMKLQGGKWKTASKGVRLDASDICKVAKGEEVKWKNYAPSFNMQTFGNASNMIKEKESKEFRKIFIERKVTLRGIKEDE